MVGAYSAARSGTASSGKPFVVALGVDVALAVLTAAVHVLVPDHGYSRWLIAGPGRPGRLALALTVGSR